jgi:hypothetical protein
MIRLCILYERKGGPPLSLVKINDANLLSVAARVAIREADEAATELSEIDTVLAQLQVEEATKLRRVLDFLLPGRTSQSTGVM